MAKTTAPSMTLAGPGSKMGEAAECWREIPRCARNDGLLDRRGGNAVGGQCSDTV